MPQAREMPALTSLRALAALLVFLYHFAPDADGLLGMAAAQGHVGVTIFFVLSGFLITVRYAGDFADGRIRLSDYFVRRAARILPLYLFVLAVSSWAMGDGWPSWRRLPEWTLTQGFLSRSLHDLVIPTSWSLTVEECFYAIAPLLLLAIAAQRRRGRRAAAALVLTGASVALLAAGAIVVALMPDRLRETLGFLGTMREMLEHTFLGRSWEFALGSACGLAFLARPLAEGRRAALLASLASVAAVVVIVASEGAMAAAGDVGGHGWRAAWAWNIPVTLASALLILSLTVARSPVARVMSLAPLVYLGRISYALYLVQLTPLGKDLLYSLMPLGMPAYVACLYVGMCAVSALLFEAVEEPVRVLILRAWTHRGAVAPRRVTLPTRAWVAAGLALMMLVEITPLAVDHLRRRQGSAPLADVLRTVGRDPARVLALDATDAKDGDGEGYRVPLPRQWMEGPTAERRVPTWLLVYADDRRVPFVATAQATQGQPVAYYKHARVNVVAVSGVQAQRITVVRQDSGGWLALQLARVASTPEALGLGLGLWLCAAAAAAALMLRADAPPVGRVLRVGGFSAAGWLAFSVYRTPWAAALLLLQIVMLAWAAGVFATATSRRAET